MNKMCDKLGWLCNIEKRIVSELLQHNSGGYPSLAANWKFSLPFSSSVNPIVVNLLAVLVVKCLSNSAVVLFSRDPPKSGACP